MKKPPASFKYYNMPWSINSTAALTNEMGITEKDHTYIALTNDPRVPEAMLRETLLHELLHVVLNDALPLSAGNTESAHDLEENLIRIVSPRLFHLFSENPALLEYIFKKEGKK